MVVEGHATVTGSTRCKKATELSHRHGVPSRARENGASRRRRDGDGCKTGWWWDGETDPRSKLRMRARTPYRGLVTDGAEWLARRKAHIRLSTERPPRSAATAAAAEREVVARLPVQRHRWADGRQGTTGEDAKEFETRVRRHLQQARAVLMDNVVQRIVIDRTRTRSCSTCTTTRTIPSRR